MFYNTFKSIVAFFTSPKNQLAHHPSRRARLCLEALEDRCCPAGTWVWNGPLVIPEVWSNPNGGIWLHDGNATGAGEYPGMQGSFEDVVLFNNAQTGNATLDVSINSLKSLQLTDWTGRLTANFTIIVVGSEGNFLMTSTSTIDLAGENVVLQLVDLGPQTGQAANRWTAGTITGSATSSVDVIGTRLEISGAPTGLGAYLNVQQSQAQNSGYVTLIDMTNNLTLTGEANYLAALQGGYVELSQQVGIGQSPGTVGGIELGGNHSGTLSLLVGASGKLRRIGVPAPGGPANQVNVAGTIHNVGGVVEVGFGALLNITGQDGNGYSYWQHNSQDAKLHVDELSRVSATGGFQIDTGTVRLTAPGEGTHLALSGTGLTFGDSNSTFLTIVDAVAGITGSISINGSVYLGMGTRTTMQFNGSSNFSNFLDVHDGTLTLNGALQLVSQDLLKPTQPLTLFASSGEVSASILGAFLSISDNLNGMDTGYTEMVDSYLYYFKVSIE